VCFSTLSVSAWDLQSQAVGGRQQKNPDAPEGNGRFALMWYPRLWYGTPEERNVFEIIGDGALIHWPELDEDLSVSGMLAGRKSGESSQSLKRWLDQRAANYQKSKSAAEFAAA
jgi:hypothetical protein